VVAKRRAEQRLERRALELHPELRAAQIGLRRGGHRQGDSAHRPILDSMRNYDNVWMQPRKKKEGWLRKLDLKNAGQQQVDSGGQG
jgi:hypothetical protein